MYVLKIIAHMKHAEVKQKVIWKHIPRKWFRAMMGWHATAFGFTCQPLAYALSIKLSDIQVKLL